MLCDIDADFHPSPGGVNTVDGSLHLHDTEDHHLTKVEVEFAGTLSYMCPVLTSRNNFADTEPQYSAKECKFISLSQTFDMDMEHLDFHFDIPNQIQLSDAMRKRLTLAKRASDSVQGYPLPPSFSSQHHSYLQTLFIPWKERSSASVDYSVKVTVVWQAKPGVGRLLGSTRQKSFRKSVTVIPYSMEGVRTTLPGYTKASGRHWQRQMSYNRDGTSDLCSVFVDPIAKMRLLGDNCLTVDRPLDFTLELNGKWRELKQVQVAVNLVMTVSTKMMSKLNEVERRNSKILMNRILVRPCAEQVDTSVDPSLDNFHCAHYNTSEKQMRGTLHLLEDSSEKAHLLSPPFTFAGLTIEYRLQVQIASPITPQRIAFNTPTIILDSADVPESLPPPPSYASISTSIISVS